MRKNIKKLNDKFVLLIDGSAPFVAKEVDGDIALEKRQDISLEERLSNCDLVSSYLIKMIKRMNLDSLKRDEFREIQRIIDEQYVYVKKATREKGVETTTIIMLRAQTLVLKLGGKIPVEWMIKQHEKPFWLFIVRNFFQHDFFSLRLQVPFDHAEGPSLPIYRGGLALVWIPFQRINIVEKKSQEKFEYAFEGKQLFKSNTDYRLGDDYFCFYNGIQEYNIFLTNKWLPHDKKDPIEWEKKNILEVWTTAAKDQGDHPSMFLKTHAYMVLLSHDGYIRSVGQDALIDFLDYKVLEVLSTKSGYGKILTPDLFVHYPTNARIFQRVSFVITKEQHDKIVTFVELDKKNKNHTMSAMKNNCVSYTLRILREVLGFDLDASFNGIHVLFKGYAPDKWYRRFSKSFMPWYKRQTPFVQKAIHFFPPYYLAFFVTAVGASLVAQNNFGDAQDFRLKDVLLSPWLLEVDHPLCLHRVLEQLADKDGFISLEKDQSA